MSVAEQYSINAAGNKFKPIREWLSCKMKINNEVKEENFRMRKWKKEF